MESKSPAQVPNGSAGVAGTRPVEPPQNGDGGLPEPGSRHAARADGAARAAPQADLDAAPPALPPAIVRREPEEALLQAYVRLQRSFMALFAALVRQAAGRPIGPRELIRSLREQRTRTAEAAKREEREPGYSTVVIARDDALPTICGKLDSAPMAEVAMLVPNGNVELSTEVGMRLLVRHADWSGKDIVLVTRRQMLRRLARAEGLRYAGSAQRVPFSRRSRPLLAGWDLAVPALSTVAWLAGVGAVAAIAALALVWFFPSGTLTLFPPTAPVSQEQSLNVDPVANRVDSVNNVVPADLRTLTVTRTLQLPVTGTASAAQVSGDPVTVPAVSDADLKAANDLATAALADQAVQDLAQRDGETWLYFPQTAKVDVQSVVPSQRTGTATPFLQITYLGSVSILGAKQSDLRALLLPHLQGKVPAGKQLIDSSEQVTVEKAGPYDPTSGRLPLLLRLDAATSSPVDAVQIQRSLRGKSRRSALAYAANAVAGAGEPRLQLSPSWLPWLPRWAGRVRVELAARS